jgi:acyl-CoA synthetase (AMP-forming)/AMP-acid ligase II
MWKFNSYKDNTAAIDESGCAFSYTFLEDEGRKLAAKVGGRKLVFYLCTNTIGSLLGYTAFLSHRIVPLMLDAGISSALLDNLISIYKPDFIYKPDQSGEFGYTLERTEWDSAYPLYDELALLLTTSGSTGSPKFVRQSYANIKANTASIVEYLELGETERAITTLPMNYTYGLSIINSHLAVGGSIILTEKTLMQREFWQSLKSLEATSFGGVPYTYEMLDKLRFSRMDLPSLKTMTQAGGKLLPDLHRKFAEYAEKSNKHFVVMYGQTEATARMSYLPWQNSLEKAGSIGIAIPGGELSLIDTNGGKINTPEMVGELIYKGKNVTLGYAERGEDLIKGDERGGVLQTGDIAKFDSDGYYYIVGRKKRFLKLFGNRINLDEIEQMLRSEFSETDIACGGVDDKMVIYTDRLEEGIVPFISEKTGINRSAFETAVIEKIPRSEAGKILYSKLP